jgi:hypothetical protein
VLQLLPGPLCTPGSSCCPSAAVYIAAPLTAAVPAVSLSMTPAIDTSRYAPLGVPDLAAAAAAAANPLLGLSSASAAALQLRLASAAGAAQHADMKDDPNDKSETRRQRRSVPTAGHITFRQLRMWLECLPAACVLSGMSCSTAAASNTAAASGCVQCCSSGAFSFCSVIQSNTAAGYHHVS